MARREMTAAERTYAEARRQRMAQEIAARMADAAMPEAERHAKRMAAMRAEREEAAAAAARQVQAEIAWRAEQAERPPAVYRGGGSQGSNERRNRWERGSD